MTLISRRPRPAITLLELLLAMSLLGVLLGLGSTWVQRAREAANLACCQAHLKDLALAMHHYETDRRKMPPYASGRPRELRGSWYVHLLPYVGRESLYEQLQASQQTVHDGIHVVTNGMYVPRVKHAVFPELACASDPTRHAVDGDNATNYLANWYALSDGIRGMYRRPQRLGSLSNGLSNVVLLAEAYSRCQDLQRLALYSAHYHNFGITQDGLPSDDPWYAPREYLMFQVNPTKCDPWRTQTAHNVMPVALADGSVRTVLPSISPNTWKYLVRARDGGTAASDW